MLSLTVVVTGRRRGLDGSRFSLDVDFGAGRSRSAPGPQRRTIPASGNQELRMNV